MRILFTGFEPFCGGTVNPSWEAVRLLPDTIGTHTIDKKLLPVVFGHSAAVLAAYLRDTHPDAVVMVGLAGNRTDVTPEKIAINYRAAVKADNSGATQSPGPIEEGGPDGIITRLPAEAMVDAVRAAGLPASLSLSAGSFVCNDTYYRIARLQETLNFRCIFVHVPPEDRLSFADGAKAMEIIAETIIACSAD